MNERCREVILSGLASRNREKTATVVNHLTPSETQLTAKQMDRLQSGQVILIVSINAISQGKWVFCRHGSGPFGNERVVL